MNKRIKELAEQTGYIWHASGDPQIYEFTPEKLAKFADMIVRECIQVCADRGTHHDGLYSAWADDCSKRIGKHFGVEE
jgi:hypothetical protein